MTSESPDLLGRKSLYRYLERELGDLTTLPQRMTARKGWGRVHIERIFDHNGQVVLSMSGQTIEPWFRSAKRPWAYILIDLKQQRAQAAPHLQAFQSVYSLNVSKVTPGIAERFAYRYGYKVERPAPSRKTRFVAPQDVHFSGRVIRLKTKTPLKYRAQTVLRKIADRLRFRLVETPAAIPLQERPSARQSWLGSISKKQNLDKVLHKLGVPPRDQLRSFSTLSRDQRYSRFCNLSTQKLLNWLYDQNYHFEAQGPRRDLLFSVEKTQEKPAQPIVKSVQYGQRQATITVQLSSGKTVSLSLTSVSKEAWNQILATPIRQQAERSVVRQGWKQEEREAPKLVGHSYKRHSVQASKFRQPFSEHKPQSLKIAERFRTQDGEVLKVQLRGGQSVYCSISDSSPDAVQTLLSPKMRMAREMTPITPKREQRQKHQVVAQPKPRRPKP